MTRRVAFVGAGAMGSFVGGMLARAGHDITLIDGWPEHIGRIKAQGLLITGTHGRHEVRVKALHIHEVQGLVATPLDVAFIAAKAYDSEWATALIKDYLAPDAPVVSLQNGLNEERISRMLGGAPVVGCIASTLGAEIQGPGHVSRAYRPGGEAYAVFRVGEVDGRVTERVEWLVELLGQVDTARATTNLVGERWSKLVANAMTNALAAITGLRDREMSRHPEVRRLSLRLGIEAVRVGQALGYALVPVLGIALDRWIAAGEGREVEQLDRALGEAAERATDQSRPSTPLDIELGRRTELDFFNGLVIARGRELGIPTPVNESVLVLARSIERGALAGVPSRAGRSPRASFFAPSRSLPATCSGRCSYPRWAALGSWPGSPRPRPISVETIRRPMPTAGAATPGMPRCTAPAAPGTSTGPTGSTGVPTWSPALAGPAARCCCGAWRSSRGRSRRAGAAPARPASASRTGRGSSVRRWRSTAGWMGS
jgi:2-dehydropantoate 2-reductase